MRATGSDSLDVDLANLARVAELLREMGVFFWLDQGTLLGAIRDGAFIPWDSDIDLSVWQDDFQTLVDAAATFRRAGFYFEVHPYKSCIFLSRSNGRNIEIAGQTRDGDCVERSNAMPRNRWHEKRLKQLMQRLPRPVFNALRHFLRKHARRPSIVFRTPSHLLSKFEDIEFRGLEGLKIPSPPEDYLRFKYGEDWRTPRSDWDYSVDDGAVTGNLD